jgi:2-dehydro-3-deoxyphosphogluconate aldolase/(4S)-4-hydroxy-2-oxoglutarate aldolase
MSDSRQHDRRGIGRQIGAIGTSKHSRGFAVGPTIGFPGTRAGVKCANASLAGGSIMHVLFRGTTVIPVVTIERERDAVPLARALFEGGLPVIEITLRTAAAAPAIAAIARQLPQIAVGAGTLLRAADVATAVQAGARFLVSPGMTSELAATALAAELPYLPGVATPSEVMMARALGICVMKFFPAEALGGVSWLRALAPVFPGVVFCPTGGIDEASAADYLALLNVPMVGGSWMAPKEAIAAGDWGRVRRLAERAAAIGCQEAA